MAHGYNLHTIDLMASIDNIAPDNDLLVWRFGSEKAYMYTHTNLIRNNAGNLQNLHNVYVCVCVCVFIHGWSSMTGFISEFILCSSCSSGLF